MQEGLMAQKNARGFEGSEECMIGRLNRIN